MSQDPEDPALVLPAGGRPSTGFPAGVTYLLTAATLVIVLVGMRQIGDILGPAFLALTLLLAIRPLHRWMMHKKVPGVLSGILVLLLLYVLILGLMALIGVALSQLVQKLPDYTARFTELYQQILTVGGRFGLSQATLENTVRNYDWQNLISYATSTLGKLGGASTQVATLLVLLFFLAIDSAQVSGRLTALSQWKPHLSDSLHRFAYQVRQYWIVSTVFGLIVAVLDVIALMLLGVPLALTWGVFSFVTNYIPNIGFILGLIPPALIALLDGGLTKMIWVIVVYAVINLIIQTIIQPKFTGDAVGINTTITFISLLFWSVVIGPLGALLAVPLTLFFKAVFVDSDPSTRWLNLFLRADDEEKAPAAGRP